VLPTAPHLIRPTPVNGKQDLDDIIEAVLPTHFVLATSCTAISHYSLAKLHRLFGCWKFDYGTLKCRGDGLHVTTDWEPPLTIGDTVNVNRGARGGAIPKPPGAQHTIGADIRYGEDVGPGGFKYCLFLVGLATRYTWVYGLTGLTDISGKFIVDSCWRFFVDAFAAIFIADFSMEKLGNSFDLSGSFSPTPSLSELRSVSVPTPQWPWYAVLPIGGTSEPFNVASCNLSSPDNLMFPLDQAMDTLSDLPILPQWMKQDSQLTLESDGATRRGFLSLTNHCTWEFVQQNGHGGMTYFVNLADIPLTWQSQLLDGTLQLGWTNESGAYQVHAYGLQKGVPGFFKLSIRKDYVNYGIWMDSYSKEYISLRDQTTFFTLTWEE
jgi:hypothetical protein